MPIFILELWPITLAPSWYGLMYGVAFLCSYFLLSKSRFFSWKQKDLESLFFTLMIWVIVGWRFGYVIFYNLPYFFENPVEIFMPWLGGMSFHGGCIWVIVAIFVSWKKWLSDVSFFELADSIAWVVPIGLFFWRIGNYINKELLWYEGYEWPLAIEKNGVSYFPTPLLEALLEWIVLFLMLILIRKHTRSAWLVSASFLIGYGVFRIIAEFFRTPDAQIGYLLWSWGTLWMLLSVVMIIVWLVIIFFNSIKK